MTTTDTNGDAVAERLARLQARRSPRHASTPAPPVEPVAPVNDAGRDAVAARLARLQARRSPSNPSPSRPVEPVVPTTEAPTTGLPAADAANDMRAPSTGSAPPFPVSKRLTARPARRRHAASGARIATAGLAATTLLGMVAVYGATRPAQTNAPASPAVDAPTNGAAPVPVVPVVRIPLDLPAMAPAAPTEVPGEPGPPATAPPATAPPATAPPATAPPVTAAPPPAPEPAPPADASTHASR